MGRGTQEGITARKIVASVPCDGCLYQQQRGRRKAINVQQAEYLCDQCDRSLCEAHIQYEERGDWWLCAKCLTAYERKKGLR